MASPFLDRVARKKALRAGGTSAESSEPARATPPPSPPTLVLRDRRGKGLAESGSKRTRGDESNPRNSRPRTEAPAISQPFLSPPPRSRTEAWLPELVAASETPVLRTDSIRSSRVAEVLSRPLLLPLDVSRLNAMTPEGCEAHLEHLLAQALQACKVRRGSLGQALKSAERAEKAKQEALDRTFTLNDRTKTLQTSVDTLKKEVASKERLLEANRAELEAARAELDSKKAEVNRLLSDLQASSSEAESARKAAVEEALEEVAETCVVIGEEENRLGWNAALKALGVPAEDPRYRHPKVTVVGGEVRIRTPEGGDTVAGDLHNEDHLAADGTTPVVVLETASPPRTEILDLTDGEAGAEVERSAGGGGEEEERREEIEREEEEEGEKEGRVTPDLSDTAGQEGMH